MNIIYCTSHKEVEFSHIINFPAADQDKKINCAEMKVSWDPMKFAVHWGQAMRTMRATQGCIMLKAYINTVEPHIKRPPSRKWQVAA